MKSKTNNDSSLLFVGMMSILLAFQMNNGFIFGESNLVTISLSIVLAILSIVCNVTYAKRNRKTA